MPSRLTVLTTETITPPAVDYEWLTRIPALGRMVGALMAGGIYLTVALLIVGAGLFAIARVRGWTDSKGGQMVIGALIGACVIASLPGLIGAISLTGPTTWSIP